MNSPKPTATPLASLCDAGLPHRDAEAWSPLCSTLSEGEVLELAEAWSWAGVPPHAAVTWHLAAWEAAEATPWWLLGFSPAQASFVRDRLLGLGAHESDVETWLHSGLLSNDITLFVAAGVVDPTEGRAFAALLLTDPSLRGNLTMRAVMNGFDISLLERSPL